MTVEHHSYGTAQLWDSTAMEQHVCEAALGWGSPWAKPLSLDSSALLQPGIVSVSVPAQEAQSSVFSRKGECTLWNRMVLAYIQRSPCPWSLIILSSSKWRLQIFIVCLVQKMQPWLVGVELLWLVNEDANGDLAAQLWLNRESLSPTGWNRIPGIPLQGLAQTAETQCMQAVQCGQQADQCRLFPEAQLVWGTPYLAKATRLCL